MGVAELDFFFLFRENNKLCCVVQTVRVSSGVFFQCDEHQQTSF